MPSLPQERRRTEHRNPASRRLDRLPTRAILRLMNREDRHVAAAVGSEIPSIARAVDAIVASIRKGGRLLYVGAGTSGRLAVLDASECPPTYGVSPNVVQALISAADALAASGKVYNIGNGQSTTIVELVRDLNALLDAAIRPSFAPARAGDVRLSQADITRARVELGYDPKVSFRDGLARTLAAYRTSDRSG